MLRSLGALVIRPTSSSSSSSRRRACSMSASVSRSLGGTGPTTLRVVTYNVLCSHLGGPDYFTACDPAALAPTTRLARVMAKLHAETERGSLLCLQEVSMTWTGPLTKVRPAGAADPACRNGSGGGRTGGSVGVASQPILRSPPPYLPVLR